MTMVDDMVSEIRPGIDNRSSVTAAMGSPTMTATFDEDTWYYVSQTKQSIAFFKPKTTMADDMVSEILLWSYPKSLPSPLLKVCLTRGAIT